MGSVLLGMILLALLLVMFIYCRSKLIIAELMSVLQHTEQNCSLSFRQWRHLSNGWSGTIWCALTRNPIQGPTTQPDTNLFSSVLLTRYCIRIDSLQFLAPYLIQRCTSWDPASSCEAVQCVYLYNTKALVCDTEKLPNNFVAARCTLHSHRFPFLTIDFDKC
jgi:hypothetical protein